MAQLTKHGELVFEKQQLEIHMEICCGAKDGTCPLLERLGEVQYLLGEAS